MPDPAKPWVLVRKGHPPWPFETLDKAKAIYNALRFGRGGTDADATVFGPGGTEWRCPRFRDGQWIQVFGDRRTSSAVREEAGA